MPKKITLKDQLIWASGKLETIRMSDPDHVDADYLQAIITTLQAADPRGVKFEQYQVFVSLYLDFFRGHVGADARLSPAEGVAMKRIITYLKREANEQTEDGALDAWRYILQHWNRLDDFLQERKRLAQIDKNLTEIIDQLKNHAKKGKQSAAKATARDIRSAIDEKRRRRSN